MSECSLTNLGSCLPESFFDYFSNLVSKPIEGLLKLSQDAITYPVDTSLFLDVASVIIYILSMFYLLLFLKNGLMFITSSYDPVKRKKAIEGLRKTITIIVLVSASYFLYNILIDISSAISVGVLNQIPDEFFTNVYTDDGAENFIFGIILLIVLFVQAILLIIRYLIVCIGVVFFPIGIFFNFVDILESYGKTILVLLLSNMFLPFFLSIILMVFSKLDQIPIFEEHILLLHIGAHGLVNSTIILVWTISILKGIVEPVKKLI